ncbi:MAG TPA: hypothetical protein VHE30_11160 [Polyangiaceae bacterium]|nr:hypothetical protein [Polyangiaceae bacterium]
MDLSTLDRTPPHVALGVGGRIFRTILTAGGSPLSYGTLGVGQMANKIDKHMLGVRAQDFHEGLKEVASYGPKEVHLKNTLLIGKAATLAAHLRGLNAVEDHEALAYLAADLGISGLELDRVLRELETVDFATIKKNGDTIKRIELRIPELREGYEELGNRWEELHPSEVERAAVEMLHDVAAVPRPKEDLQRSSGLDTKNFELVLSIGSTGALMETYEDDDGEPLIYSPLTVEENPRPLIELARKFPSDDVVLALNAVRNEQGLPEGIGAANNNPVIIEAVLSGVLAPVRIQTAQGERRFFFAPRGQIPASEKVILDKARAILACVRSGQHFADYRKIFNPAALLRKLRREKTFSYSRPDYPEQYGLLVSKQIAIIDPDTSRDGFFHFHLLDTDENIKALDLAIGLLEVGDASTAHTSDAQVFLGIAGSYAGAPATRTRMAKFVKRSKTASRHVVTTISKLLRGVVA